MTSTAKTNKFIVLSVYRANKIPISGARWANSGAVCPDCYWFLLLEANKITALADLEYQIELLKKRTKIEQLAKFIKKIVS